MLDNENVIDNANAHVAGNSVKTDDYILIPTVSYYSLKKSMRVIQDMVLYYFPLHNLEFKDCFRLLPMLIFAEATAYQNDEEYEANLVDPKCFSPSLNTLVRILEQASLYDEQLSTELQRGIKYWQMERKLCSDSSFTEADIVENTRFKCCDYRFLHRLMFRLLNKPYDEELLDLSWVVEQIGEIEDDLLQYSENVVDNVYNTYHLYVRLYGDNARQHFQAHLDSLYAELNERETSLAATRPELERLWQQVQARYAKNNPAPDVPAAITDSSVPAKGNFPYTPIELTPTLSYKAITKAMIIVEEMINFYFPLHGLDESDAFTWLTELIFAEAMLYQIDEEHEANINNPGFESAQTQVLRSVLKTHGWYDKLLDAELQSGLEYCLQEQKMCTGEKFTEEDVIKATYFKCCDYRFLHRLLFLLTRKPYIEELITVCSLVEEAGEIEDDIRQYHSDIERNVYNTYRMFVKLHGKNAPRHLKRHIESLEKKIEEQLEGLYNINPEWIEIGNTLQEAYYRQHPSPVIPAPLLET